MSAVLVVTGAGPLDAAALERVMRAAGAGPMRRLAGEAGEAAAPDADPARLVAARAAAAEIAADANLLPAAGREKRLLLADMDGTVIGCECIDEIADLAGVGPQVAAITEAAMRGELDFEGALAARVALLEGLEETALERVYAERVRLNPGAATLARTMAARGAATALVSGGFTFFSARVAAAAGFARHHANVLETAGGRLTGRVAPPVVGREAKRARLLAIAAEIGAGPAEALAVGDGANDLAMIGEAGLGVAWRAKPAVAAAADARIDHADLTALLHLQGVPREAWVER